MKIEKIIYGWMPDNEISIKEKNEFVEQADKLKCNYILHENFDHVPTPDVYEKVNTYRNDNGVTKGPAGAGTASNFCSHISIWHRIVKENIPCAVFEHDARPVINFENLIDIDDGMIMLLGPRIDRLDRYQFPDMEIKYYNVSNHAGSHAYAITPKTASMLIEHVEKEGINDSIDQWLFLRQKPIHIEKFLKLFLVVCDPPVAVAVYGDEQGKKESSVGRSSGPPGQPEYNLYMTPGFKEGIMNE